MEVSILKTLELKIQNLEVKSKSSDHSLHSDPTRLTRENSAQDKSYQE